MKAVSRLRRIRSYERRINAAEALHRKTLRYVVKRARTEGRNLGTSLKRLVAGPDPAPAEDWNDAVPDRERLRAKLASRSRVLVDVTAAYRGGFGGGILRTCMKLAVQMADLDDALPVVRIDGRLRPIGYLDDADDVVTLRSTDVYVVFDTFWHPLDEYEAGLKAARAKGARTVVCIYDVVPLIFPGLVEPHYVKLFDKALRRLLPFVDCIVTISRSSAREIRRALRRRGYAPRKVVWFHLGADSFADAKGARRPPAARPSFLSIGTLEPKKGYDIALDAFDVLWAGGRDVSYTIVGSRGWLCDALVERILGHREYGQRLIWLEGASDNRLGEAMAGSQALIQASVAEGFGIPLVEASCQGLPVIASDLPVFREVAGADTRFFTVCDPAGLAASVEQAMAEPWGRQPQHVLTWARSAAWLVAELRRLGMSEKVSTAQADPERPRQVGSGRRANVPAPRELNCRGSGLAFGEAGSGPA